MMVGRPPCALFNASSYCTDQISISTNSMTKPKIKIAVDQSPDMAAKQDLIASGRSLEEIKVFLGCDNLVYQDLEDLVSSVMELNPELDGVEKSIFDGEYPTNISDEYLYNLEKARSMANL